jgi:hypothetical protein
LEQYTSQQILDFYHTTNYLEDAAKAAYPYNDIKRQKWLDERCHQLKHDIGSANQILAFITTFRQKKLTKVFRDKLESAITFFNNHQGQMNYASAMKDKIPIGSGVTEAVCKTVVKQKLCQFLMRWLDFGASIVLGLRTLVLTKKRWTQFWNKINQYGLPQET